MKYILGMCCLLLSFNLFAQPETPEEEIFAVVSEMPMFPGCIDSTDNYQALKNCADKKMLEFMYSNIKYPEVDLQKGNEGTAVVQFVVEKDGSISNPKILNDPGEQLGEETLRVVELMNYLPSKWTPGKQADQVVRVYFNLPIKFKIQEIKEPDFVMAGLDTIWVKFDKPLEYKGGAEALAKYIDQNIKYPQEGQDSCRIGIIEMNTLIFADGTVKILDVIDYSDLGIDYQFEAIRVMNSTNGNWIPASYQARAVNANYNYRFTFRPNMVACGNRIKEFETADQLADEAAIMLDKEQLEEGIAKLSEAITMFPDNAEFLSMRGQAYLKLQKTDEACIDLLKVQDILITSWLDNLLPILCR